ncbi:methyl-accepting chemotaxis protein, partial [Campylobacter helveticus]
MFKSLNIGLKLILSVAITVIIGVIAFISLTSVQVSSNMKEQMDKVLMQASKRYANYIEAKLNETIALVKSASRTINEDIRKNGFDFNDVENVIKNTFDSSSETTFAFFLLEDSAILGDTNVKKQYRSEKGTFGMEFVDTAVEKSGGIETLQFSEKIKSFPVVQRIRNEAKTADYDKVYVGVPAKLDMGRGEFIGVNIAMPVFDTNGKYIGCVGFVFDLQSFSTTLMDPILDLYDGNIRVLLSEDSTVAVHSTNLSLLLKNLAEISSSPQTKEIVNAVKENKDFLFENYTSSSGEESFVAIASFTTLDNSSKWSILTTAPKASVLAPLYKMQFIFVAIGIIFLIAVIAVVYYCVRVIIGARLPILVKSLETLFRFLNHEKVEPHIIKINADDELGAIGKMLNENILATKQGLDQDKQAVKESVETVGIVENGNLTARITANPRNPQLIELKNVLN